MAAVIKRNVLGAGLVLLVAGILAALFLYSRARKPLPAAPPPLAVVYRALEPGKPAGLRLLDLTTSTSRPLTPGDWAVAEYALSPDGQRLAVVVDRGSSGTALWQVPLSGEEPRLLLACPQDACTRPLWHPARNGLVYEQRPLEAADDAGTPPALWWLDAGTGQTNQLDLVDQQSGFGSQFSPNGRWFSLSAPADHALELYDLDSGQQLFSHFHTTRPVFWRPDSSGFLLLQEDFREGQFTTNLLWVDVTSGQPENLSHEALVDDGPPAWSPDGQWIAFSRRFPQVPMGRQLWLMQLGGSQPMRRLTGDTRFHHAGISWSPDGRSLLFQRTDLSASQAGPQVWLLELATGEERWLADGDQPLWAAP